MRTNAEPQIYTERTDLKHKGIGGLLVPFLMIQIRFYLRKSVANSPAASVLFSSAFYPRSSAANYFFDRFAISSKYFANATIPPEACCQSKFSLGA
jgi:hypothetical protein